MSTLLVWRAHVAPYALRLHTLLKLFIRLRIFTIDFLANVEKAHLTSLPNNIIHEDLFATSFIEFDYFIFTCRGFSLLVNLNYSIIYIFIDISFNTLLDRCEIHIPSTSCEFEKIGTDNVKDICSVQDNDSEIQGIRTRLCIFFIFMNII